MFVLVLSMKIWANLYTRLSFPPWKISSIRGCSTKSLRDTPFFVVVALFSTQINAFIRCCKYSTVAQHREESLLDCCVLRLNACRQTVLNLNTSSLLFSTISVVSLPASCDGGFDVCHLQIKPTLCATKVFIVLRSKTCNELWIAFLREQMGQ